MSLEIWIFWLICWIRETLLVWIDFTSTLALVLWGMRFKLRNVCLKICRMNCWWNFGLIFFFFFFLKGTTSQKGIELYRVLTEGYWTIIFVKSGVLTSKMSPRRAFRLFSALKRDGSRFTWLPHDFFNVFGHLFPWLQRINQVWNLIHKALIPYIDTLSGHTLPASAYLHQHVKGGFFLHELISSLFHVEGFTINLCPTVNQASTGPLCKCGLKACSWKSFTMENFGRRFYSCVNYKVNNFFPQFFFSP